MASPELLILLLNAALALLAYLVVYPRVAGCDLNKISLYDVVVSAVALGLVGTQFWGSGYAFKLIVFEVNWFWYTLITFTAIESPLMLWYFRKNNVALKQDEQSKR